jgi:hypothetical protein
LEPKAVAIISKPMQIPITGLSVDRTKLIRLHTKDGPAGDIYLLPYLLPPIINPVLYEPLSMLER